MPGISRTTHRLQGEVYIHELQSSMATMNFQKWFHPSFWSSRLLSLLPVTWSPCQRHHPHSCIGRAAWNHSILWFRYSIAVKTVGPMKSERWSASMILLLVRQLSIRSDEMPKFFGHHCDQNYQPLLLRLPKLVRRLQISIPALKSGL